MYGMRPGSRRQFLQRCAATTGLGLVGNHAAEAPACSSQSGGTFRLGVNLAGAEFDAIGGRWRWPSLTNLTYYLSCGFTIFRIPFRWARLQPALRAPLPEDGMEGLDGLVALINARGAVALLDAHDYGRRDGQIIAAPNSSVTGADFADFWGRMAKRYKSRRLVWYNLMNEPHDMPAEANLKAQNAACEAIREAGAGGKVLFSGIAWTGAHSWVKSGNAEVMLGARDSGRNYAFDVHQYLDEGFGGAGRKKAVTGAGAHILSGVTEWARVHGKELFLGEFGCGPTKEFLAELGDLLAYATSRRDVFIGGTYFAGGGGWGRNPGSSDPIDGVEKPQTLLLKKYLER